MSSNHHAEHAVHITGFEITGRLGEGTMGMVYRARELASGRDVAIKVLYPMLAGNMTYLQRFRAEAEAATHLNHPNLVAVHGAGQEGLTHYIVMDLVEGKNLRELIDQEGALSEATVAAVGMCVASALDYAWEKERLIHRDVKPENILVGDDGLVKLCDLGIAKRMAPKTGDKALTRTGHFLGTPHYIAPEQLKGARELDKRVDIFSLGATLYHAVTGQVIHEAENEYDLILKQAGVVPRHPQEVLPGLSNEFARLLVEMLHLDRENRVSDWATVYDRLFEIYQAQADTVGRRAQFRVDNSSTAT